MATDFKYATISDLTKYVNKISDYDSKTQIFPTLTSGNLHLFRNSGLATTLFVNGEELGSAESSSGAVTSNGQWFYASGTNQVEYYNDSYSSSTINDQLFEVGVDFTDFLNQSLVDASLELHNYIDARYSTPIEKQKQIDIDSPAVTNRVEEYDPIIIKATCYIAAANLMRAKEGMSEEADYYMSLVTNFERTGIIDKLNDGIYKLSYEVDDKDKSGKILFRSVVSAGLDIVEMAGQYHGEHYDMLKVEIDTPGAYGVATFTVKYLAGNKLEGGQTEPEIITGGLQQILNGLYCRWQGNSADAGDYWHIEVYGSHRKQTNKSNATIEMER